jgi:serine/threonine protein phosphatase PrpC
LKCNLSALIRKFLSQNEKFQIKLRVKIFKSFFVILFDNEKTRNTHTWSSQDAHQVVDKLGGNEGQGFFAIYDGHCGNSAALWCKNHLHEVRTLQYNLPIEKNNSRKNKNSSLD